MKALFLAVLLLPAMCKAEEFLRVDLVAHAGLSYFLTDKGTEVLDPKGHDEGLRLLVGGIVLLGGLVHEFLGPKFGWEDLGADLGGVTAAVIRF